MLTVVTILLATASVRDLRSQIRARVDLVEVPVSVTDSKGRLVPGLTGEDFIVLEDGAVQTISNFSTDPLPLSAAIVVDSGLWANDLRRLAPLFPAVTAGFSADDEMISFRYDQSVWKLSEFTSDPAEIEKSFGGIAAIAETRPVEAGDLLGDKGPALLRSILGLLKKTTGARVPKLPGRVLHDAVYDAAMALQSRPSGHRKIIFIISNGQGGGSKRHSLISNTALLLQNGIQVYGVSTEYAIFGSFGALTSYADATGGDVFAGTSTSSMEPAFSRITEQARYQYVLGYVSTNRAGRSGVPRTIEVKTRSKQKVTHRQTYIQHPSD